LIQIKSVSCTAVLSWVSTTRHVALRIGNNRASIVDLVSAVTFSSILDTNVGIRIDVAVGSANLGAHHSVVGGGVWGQRANIITLRVASNADTGDTRRGYRCLMDWSPRGGSWC
jgi:hypothetical protein